jgi:hypothetical protein
MTVRYFVPLHVSGFGTSIVAARVTYVVGLRLVLRDMRR